MSEPTGAPTERSTAGDVRWALDRARRHIFGGGCWTVALGWYVDAWLDFALERGIAAELDRRDELAEA